MITMAEDKDGTPPEEPAKEPAKEPKPDSPPSERQTPAPADPSRRGALGTLVVVGSAAYAGALAIPGYGFIAGEADRLSTSGERWLRVAPLESLPDGAPVRVKARGDARDAFTVAHDQTLGSVWLTRSGESVRALSAECPHLGCAIDLAGDGTNYSCPCHTSKFGLDGQSHSGPSPRAMDELATRVVEGWVEVDFRRFRQGVTTKMEI